LAGKNLQSNSDTPGPGYYLAEKVEVVPVYKYKQSSMFASKVDRVGRKMRNSFNDNMTTGNVKVKSKLVSAGVKPQHALSPLYENPNGDMMDDDEYYDEDDDGTTPGPGSYFNP
jgi:hypothetical protein